MPHFSRFPLGLLPLFFLPLTAVVSCGEDKRPRGQIEEESVPAESSDVGGAPALLPEKVDKKEGAPREVEGQEVMAWVPAYSIQGAKNVWLSQYGAVKVPSTLTRIGLQFWTMTEAGGLEELFDGNDTEAAWFVERAHAEGVQVLATVTNSETKTGGSAFDWGVVREGLKGEGYKTLTVELLDLVERLNLDGVDLDLESGGEGVLPYTSGDRALFGKLANYLGKKLHAQGKLLTVDTFVSNNGLAPQPSWWSDWIDNVDTLHAMGYTLTFAGGLGNASYQTVQDLALSAGYSSNQILMGLPLWVDSWAGDDSGEGVSHVENLQFIANCLQKSSGVALWALDQPSSNIIQSTGKPSWSSVEAWQNLLKIREGHELNESLCKETNVDPSLVEDMKFVGINRRGGRWFAANDYWDRSEAERDGATKVLTFDESYDLALGEGAWGYIKNGYREVGGRRVISAQINAESLAGGTAWGGLWMEFLPRDCAQLPEGDMSCGWAPKALTELDVSNVKDLVLGVRCEKGKVLTAQVLSRSESIAGSPGLLQELECTGEFKDYKIALEGRLSQIARLQLALQTTEVPASLSFDIAGVALDASVIE